MEIASLPMGTGKLRTSISEPHCMTLSFGGRRMLGGTHITRMLSYTALQYINSDYQAVNLAEIYCMWKDGSETQYECVERGSSLDIDGNGKCIRKNAHECTITERTMRTPLLTPDMLFLTQIVQVFPLISVTVMIYSITK